jgi:hypothetical protein
VAALQPPHRAAICPWEGAADCYRDMLATLPLLDGELRGLPRPHLRELLESLHPTVSYDHKAHSAQITITLATEAQVTTRS